QDEQVAAVEQVIGQVHAADAEIPDLHARGHRPLGQQPDHLDAEGVVAQEHVAHARHQRPPAHRTGSTSSGMKYRKRPCAIRTTSSGWSASDTARYGWSSTSCSTAWTSASRPTRNMSCASARRAPGRSRTRLPRATGWPPMVTLSVSGDTDASAS